MNRTNQRKSHQRIINIAGASLLLASCFVSVAQAQTAASVRVETLPTWMAERLVEKSRLGVDQAVNYLNRTRAIHQLNNHQMLGVLESARVAAVSTSGGAMVAEVSSETK